MKLLAYLVVVLAVLGALFVFFKPQRAPEVQTAQTTAPAAGPGVAAPAPSAAPSPSATSGAAVPAAPAAAVAAPAAAGKVFDLVVRGGRLVSGPTVVKVEQGDDVTLNVTADTNDELHVHGYDLHAKTRPGETQSFHFVANRTGRFGIELHHSGAELGALEVYPR